MLLLLLSALSHAAEVGLTVQPQLSLDLARDRPGEDSVEDYTWLRAWAEGREGEARWFIEARALHVVLIGDDIESVVDPDLGESGVSLPVGPLHVTAGHLIERWGRLDLLPVADVLNGRDLRAGPQTPLALSRLPTPMLTAELPWSWGRAELAWAPVPGVNRTSVQGTDWSLVRQGMVEGLIADIASWETELGGGQAQELLMAAGSGLSGDDPWTRWQQSESLSQSGLPLAFGPQSDLALRLSAGAGRVDGALLGGWLRTRQGAVVVDESLVTYLREERLPSISEVEALDGALSEPYSVLAPRGPVVGAELGGMLGPVGLRGEALWRKRAVVTQQWLQATTREEVSAGLGADYARGAWLFMVEGSWRRIGEAEDLLLTARDTVRVAGAVQGRLLRERLSVRVGGLCDVTFREHLVQPGLSWRASDQLEVGLSALVLGGPAPAPQAFAEAMTYSGGLLGYWGDNDNISAQLTWIR